MRKKTILKNLIGNRYGRLTVKEFSHMNKKHSYWLCVCDCGNTHIVRSDCLKNGYVQSCGCLNKEPRNVTHGQTKTKLYHVWASMKNRCLNDNDANFRHYGGRGIKVCDDWLKFEPFRNWALSHGYEEGLSIDRIDVNGNYESSNCRWVTRDIQAKNRRPRTMDILIEYNGVTKNLREVAKECGIKYATLYYRYKRGLPLFSPIK